MKKFILVVFIFLLVFLFGCQSFVEKCNYEINDMIDVQGEIIDTHVLSDKSTPANSRTIVTIRTSECDLFALKEETDYEITKSEDILLKVDKNCIPEDSGYVTFKGLYREYTFSGFTYDITPSYCTKASENVPTNVLPDN